MDELLNKSQLFSSFMLKEVKGAHVNEDPDDEGSHLTPTQRQFPMIKVELMEHQLVGARWMAVLWVNGMNGILADQMGMGKTAQTIAFLSHLKQKDVHGPFLIVAPLSTLTNWIKEFHRFCPDLPAFMYHGSKDERAALREKHFNIPDMGDVPNNFPVIVTSYETIISDKRHLRKFYYKYIVVDEGHRLKNSEGRLVQELKQIPSLNRLLLTGTPIQNNLDELWSLLNFIQPNVFSNLKTFKASFDFSSVIGTDGATQQIMQAEKETRAVSMLHSILKPYVLRRLKADVDIQLPLKAEVVLYAEMTKEQKSLHLKLLEGSLKDDMQALATREGTSSREAASAASSLSNTLMQLRKICNHPDLITSPFTTDQDYPCPEDIVMQSGKMQILERLLDRLYAGGHKVVIFSQMVKMLDIIQSYLIQRKHRVCRIDGSISVEVRQQNIDDFNSNDPMTWVFLLSTRAGGLGINLTGGDTVIIYDSDWNPQMDLQAMDRCHRIGQERSVLVFRLITAHSVEGKMLKKASNKMALEKLVIKKGAYKDIIGDDITLSSEDLKELLHCEVLLSDIPQSGVVSEDMLYQIMSRSYLDVHEPCPYPSSGVGYENVNVNASLLFDTANAN